MPDMSSISHYPLKVIFAIHLVLVTWGIQGHWCPKSVMFYNFLFFVCLLWAIHNIESDEPLQFHISSTNRPSKRWMFSHNVHYKSCNGSVIHWIQMFYRPALLLQNYALMGVGTDVHERFSILGFGRQDYEDISHPIPQNSDFAGV
ncbi:uncharacterized protein LOC122711236 [Apis laboriosa]|uniref:uncharacterized protein LOC122711236 n=1 Tax=Apis laboriosa TaxID=183418 RepID=UPI001CC410BE|nr:uncharacterized protein LOC122711236 [Apis laboriosa]